MATTVASTDIVSHPVFAIITLSTGRTVKFPKVKPAGSTHASDAAWQAVMATEVAACLNQVMIGGSTRNATHHLAGLV